MRLVTFVSAIALFGVVAGCHEPAERLNAPPHGVSEHTADLQDYYHMMIDNALLEDMTISDVHFFPHRPQLTSLGEDRLARLAWLLERRGGTIRFYTEQRDEELVTQRTDVILAFLAEKGLDTREEVLREDLPGGAGVGAEQAILIRKHEAMYKPGRSGTSEPPPLEGF